MKLEAQNRLRASATMLECGCELNAGCDHAVSALTEKQKKLDIDQDGKIDGEDLEKVRQGELAEATMISAATPKEAAPITRKRRIAFMKELRSRLRPKFPNFISTDGGGVLSGDPFSAQEFEELKRELKKLGWVTPFKIKGMRGLMRKDKTWPIVCTLSGGEVLLELGYSDTLDTSTLGSAA